jgi:hypothetical protein
MPPNVVPVQPGGVSSLVFLVVIGVWAAYFIQYWVRRREHLATARSVDQFSESMRVLERRSPLPQTDLSSPPQPSYAVSPARAARPQILVKRAETAPTDAGDAAVRGSRQDAGRPTASAALTGRRNRSLVMLGALSTLLVSLPLVVFGLLPLVALLVPAVSLGGAVAWVRRSAMAERAGRRSPQRARGTATGSDVAGVSRASSPAEAPVTAAAVEVPAEAAPAPAASAPRGELFDVRAVEAANAAALDAAATSDHHREPERAAQWQARPAAAPRPLVDEDDIPLTWDPVPVPRPTYTMKARVARPASTAADLVGDCDTEHAAYEDTPVRRVAGA